MKKIITLSVLLSGMFLLAGCGQKPVSQSQPITPAPVAQKPADNQPFQLNENETEPPGWDRYKETTLNDIILENNELVSSDKKADVSTFNAKSLNNPYRVKLIYKGEYRKLPTQKNKFLEAWGKSMGVKSDNIGLYESETLLMEGGKEYWMPIQNQLIPFLKKEVAVNSSVEVLIMWPGIYMEASEPNWVFVINEFNAQ